jgi:hypothetical protein
MKLMQHAMPFQHFHCCRIFAQTEVGSDQVMPLPNAWLACQPSSKRSTCKVESLWWER